MKTTQLYKERDLDKERDIDKENRTVSQRNGQPQQRNVATPHMPREFTQCMIMSWHISVYMNMFGVEN